MLLSTAMPSALRESLLQRLDRQHRICSCMGQASPDEGTNDRIRGSVSRNAELPNSNESSTTYDITDITEPGPIRSMRQSLKCNDKTRLVATPKRRLAWHGAMEWRRTTHPNRRNIGLDIRLEPSLSPTLLTHHVMM
jgi:hypothetical protein